MWFFCHAESETKWEIRFLTVGINVAASSINYWCKKWRKITLTDADGNTTECDIVHLNTFWCFTCDCSSLRKYYSTVQCIKYSNLYNCVINWGSRLRAELWWWRGAQAVIGVGSNNWGTVQFDSRYITSSCAGRWTVIVYHCTLCDWETDLCLPVLVVYRRSRSPRQPQYHR